MFNFRKKLPWLVNISPDERDAWYSEFGQIMQRARYAMDISLTELSVALKIKEKALSDYECCAPVPFVESIAIFQYLGMRHKAEKRFQQ